jgi:enoyl-CoA hydratase
LTAAIEEFAAEDSRVMVLTGVGNRAFCSGADLKAVEGLMRRPDIARTGPLGFSGLEPRKPTVAAVEGYCLGGGIELACWCDFRVAGESAVFGALNRRVGVPWVDGGTQRLPQTVGLGNALYIMETGQRIDARRALRMGLVQEVVPAAAALGRALELAERIAAWPQVSLISDREAARASWGRTVDEGLAYEAKVGQVSAKHDELAEGTRRFGDRAHRKGR